LAGGKGVAIGKPSELENVFDVALQTRMLGGILHPVLEPETDLDDVRTPNTYVGENVSTYKYGHCPLTSGTFTLEVVGMGNEGQVKQRLTYCHKTESRAWERIYYSGNWSYNEETDPAGGWVCVSDFDGQLLSSPGMYMSGSHTVELFEPVSKQRSGIVLAWSAYVNGEAGNYDWFYHFIPKYHIKAHSGAGVTTGIICSSTGGNIGKKYVYIHDDKIVGNDNNQGTATINGITFNNSYWILRHIIGV
jgi:hypothetical protein